MTEGDKAEDTQHHDPQRSEPISGLGTDVVETDRSDIRDGRAGEAARTALGELDAGHRLSDRRALDPVEVLLGAIAVAAYSYMSLVPLIQPPIMKLFTTKEHRKIKMGDHV